MKFKTIFILFNAVIILSFLIIYCMPLLILGWEYTRFFWSKNWFLPLIFVAVIAGLNTYFIINWKLFRYLETENWDNLRNYLEKQIYQKNRVKPQYIRVLVNAYLVSSEVDKITELEQYLKKDHQDYRTKFALILGIPKILSNDREEMKSYYREFLPITSGRDGAWIKWCFAFAGMYGDEKENAKYTLLEISSQKKDPVLRLLTMYLLDGFRKEDPSVETTVRNFLEETTEEHTPATWEKLMEKHKRDIFVVILSKLIEDAAAWLFSHKNSSSRNQ